MTIERATLGAVSSAAADIRAHAPAIVARVLGRLHVAQRTVAANVLTAQFVDRCAFSAAAADWNHAAAWLVLAVQRYGEIVDVCEVVGASIDALAGTLAFASAADRGGLARVRAELALIAARPRLVVDADDVEAIDEIDIVLDRLLTQLDQSDVLTAEHSRAVASWCTRLSQRLGCSKFETVQLTRAGLIHDIGKVETPAAILSAPRRLDDDETAIMRLHTQTGARIVGAVPLIAHLVPPVRNHHERFDGAGYPDGLKWEAIPLSARIVAVADSFNAMIGRRPYRPPMAPSLALEQLVQGRETQFDPAIVDAMIDVVTARG